MKRLRITIFALLAFSFVLLVVSSGVRMHTGFPAGPALEKLAMLGRPESRIGVSVKGMNCNLAGAENIAARWLEQGTVPRKQIAAEIFDFVARTIVRMIEAACEETRTRQALLAGGVASSTLLREMIDRRAKKRRLNCRICYARPELSGDNAVGVALLGAQRYREESRQVF